EFAFDIGSGDGRLRQHRSRIHARENVRYGRHGQRWCTCSATPRNQAFQADGGSEWNKILAARGASDQIETASQACASCSSARNSEACSELKARPLNCTNRPG